HVKCDPFPTRRSSDLKLSKSISWRGILPTAIEDDSRGKVWKRLIVQVIPPLLSSLQLPTGKQKRSAELSKKKTRKQQELTYRFLDRKRTRLNSSHEWM